MHSQWTNATRGRWQAAEQRHGIYHTHTHTTQHLATSEAVIDKRKLCAYPFSQERHQAWLILCICITTANEYNIYSSFDIYSLHHWDPGSSGCIMVFEWNLWVIEWYGTRYGTHHLCCIKKSKIINTLNMQLTHNTQPSWLKFTYSSLACPKSAKHLLLSRYCREAF